jgi:hypothetical protein
VVGGSLRSAVVLSRRLAPLLTALAVVGLVATGCADQTAAAKVGDQTLSESDLLDEVKALVENEVLLELAGFSEDDLRGESDASYSQAFVGDVLAQRIQFMLLDQLFADEGMELSEADRAAGREAFESNYGESAAEFPQSYQDQSAEDFAKLTVLQSQLGEGQFQESFTSLVETMEVELSSRYGTWDAGAFLAQLLDPQNATVPPVTPPEGSRSAPGSVDETEFPDAP